MTSPKSALVDHLLRKWEFRQDWAETKVEKKTIWNTIAKYWMRFARMLGKANAVLLLTIVYFLVIGPGALLLKLLRKDLLDRRAESQNSYWYDKAPVEQGLDRSTHQF